MEPITPDLAAKTRINRIISYLPHLREGQLIWVERIVLQFRQAKAFIVNPASNLLSDCFLEDFGVAPLFF